MHHTFIHAHTRNANLWPPGNVHRRHFPWPKCPGHKVRGRNVLGQNVRAPFPQCGSYNGELQTQSQSLRHSSGLERGHKWLVHKDERKYAHKSFVATPKPGKWTVSTGSYQEPVARKSKSPPFLGSVGRSYEWYCIRHFSVTADLRICTVKHTLDLRYLRGDISAV